jgi:hypothetical protein
MPWGWQAWGLSGHVLALHHWFPVWRPDCSRPSVSFPSSLSSPLLLLLSFRVPSLPATEYLCPSLVVTPPSRPLAEAAAVLDVASDPELMDVTLLLPVRGMLRRLGRWGA